MLKLRLRRTGKRHQPYYRLVVAEHTAPIKGKFVAQLGHYNPRSKELVIRDEEILRWLGQGAQPSNTVARILKAQGMKHKLIEDAIHTFPVRPSKKTQPEGAAQAAPEEPTKTEAEPTTEQTEPSKEESAEQPTEPEQPAAA